MVLEGCCDAGGRWCPWRVWVNHGDVLLVLKGSFCGSLGLGKVPVRPVGARKREGRQGWERYARGQSVLGMGKERCGELRLLKEVFRSAGRELS